jgi:hypothetical protein
MDLRMATPPPTATSPRERLAQLLLAIYDASELRRTVRYFDDKHKTRLYAQLPEQPVTPTQLAASLAALLDLPTLHLFLDAAIADRPRRRDEIDAVRALFPRA